MTLTNIHSSSSSNVQVSFDDVPTDLKNLIVSFFPLRDMDNLANEKSPLHQQATIKLQQQISLIKELSEVVSQTLSHDESYAWQSKALHQLSIDSNLQMVEKVTEVNNWRTINKVRDTFCKILTEVSYEDLEGLKEIPIFPEKLHSLVKIYKDVKENKRFFSQTIINENIHKESFIKLVQHDEFEKALEVIGEIPSSFSIINKKEIIKQTALELIERGEFRLAVAFEKKIQGDFDIIFKTSVQIVLELIDNKAFKEALEVAGRFTKHWDRDHIFYVIAEKLLERGDLQQAIEVEKKMHSPDPRLAEKIVNELVKRGEFQQAIKTAEKCGLRDFAIGCIAEEIVQSSSFEEVKKVANIDSDYLNLLVQELTRGNHFEWILALAKGIPGI